MEVMKHFAFCCFLIALVALKPGTANRPDKTSQSIKGAESKKEKLEKLELEQEHRPRFEQVGLHPRVFYFHNFLTEEERIHMIRLAAPLMKRSSVVGEHGGSVVDQIRTSYGMFLTRLQDPIIERIERRISLYTQLPLAHQEDIQVLRYVKGQQYGAHYDSAYDNKEAGPHHRLATFYMYLSDVEEGGETAFPEKSEWFDPAMGVAADPTFSDCARGHVAAKPKAGDAALFYSFFPNGTMDMASLHTGCPVIKGIKWGAPVWIHVDEFQPEAFHIAELSARHSTPEQRFKRATPAEPGLCVDFDARCETWAKAGECERSAAYMKTESSQCRKACGVCKTCQPGDGSCIHYNRKSAGYMQLDREEFEKLGVPWWMGPDVSPEL